MAAEGATKALPVYGVIDIGSNTIRLAVYKIQNQAISPMINKKASVGLAGYISRDGRLKKAGIEKAVKTLLEFKEIINCMEIDQVFPFATASLRNISNSQQVQQEIEERTGFLIRILSGQEEAVFDYYGAIQSVCICNGLLVDIGGGSTELVYIKDRQIEDVRSLPIGSLNLYRQHVKQLIPKGEEIKALKKQIKSCFQEMEPFQTTEGFQTLCGVGGTARAAKKLLCDMKLQKEDTYDCKELKRLVSVLKQDSPAFYDNLLKSSPDRLHTFVPGLLILNTVARHYGSRQVITSDYGVREGYLCHLLEKKGFTFSLDLKPTVG